MLTQVDGLLEQFDELQQLQHRRSHKGERADTRARGEHGVLARLEEVNLAVLVRKCLLYQYKKYKILTPEGLREVLPGHFRPWPPLVFVSSGFAGAAAGALGGLFGAGIPQESRMLTYADEC